MMKETLVSICALLNKHQVEYLVIGGVAVIYHGYTRATSDIDFWYKPSIQNFNKIIEAYREYGIDVSSLEKVVFDPKSAYLRFPTQFRTKLLPAVAGELSFMEAQKASEILELEGVKIPVIGYNHLIQTKLLTNRLKDKADAEELAKRKKGHAGQ